MDSLTTSYENTNPEIKTVYTILLKYFLRARYKEIMEKKLGAESCRTSEIREFRFICLCSSGRCYDAGEFGA